MKNDMWYKRIHPVDKADAIALLSMGLTRKNVSRRTGIGLDTIRIYAKEIGVPSYTKNKPLSEETHALITKLLKEGWTNGEIASRCKCSQPTVSKLRKRLCKKN